MQGIKEKCECPICGKVYENNPRICTCGFEGLVFLPFYMDETARARFEDVIREQSFRIFKFAKQVYYGEQPYAPSELVLRAMETHVEVDEALERRGVAVVSPDASQSGGLPTVAIEGLLAMRASVRALVLNTTAAEYSMLDECRVESLLLGDRFERFVDGGLLQYAPLRYIWVDGKNKSFVARDNVLFDKKESKLLLYARSRPGEEYRVPAQVKELAPYSFYSPTYLKRLYLPRGIRISPHAFGRANAYVLCDGKWRRQKPTMEIVYY